MCFPECGRFGPHRFQRGGEPGILRRCRISVRNTANFQSASDRIIQLSLRVSIGEWFEIADVVHCLFQYYFSSTVTFSTLPVKANGALYSWLTGVPVFRPMSRP